VHAGIPRWKRFPIANTDHEHSSYILGIVFFFLGLAILGLILKHLPG
jgi:hypothetical protein